MKEAQVFRAKQFLETIEKLPPEQRQVAANAPKTAEALYAASQSDSSIKARIADLGITVSPPARTDSPGHRSP